MNYPEIQLWNTNIDAQMMWLTKNPEDYGVIVAGNMFGDIVSDAFAGLIGGLGLHVQHSYQQMEWLFLNQLMDQLQNMQIIEFQLLTLLQ